MGVNFHRIANNTNNSIIVNGTYIGPNSEAVLTDDVIALIDKQYFEKGILVNNGIANIDPNLLMIDTKTIQFYKKPPSGIPRSHLDQNLKTSLNRADRAISGKVTMDDLDTNVQSALKAAVNNGVSVNSLSKATLSATAEDQSYRKPPSGILKSDLNEEVRTSLSRADRALTSGTVTFDDLDQTLKTRIVSTQGTSPSLTGPNSILITESQLEKPVRDKLYFASEMTNRISKVGITYSDLSPEIRGIIEKANLSEDSYWRDPVLNIALLPTTGNKNGDIIVSLDDGILRRWNTETAQWVQVSPSIVLSTPALAVPSAPIPAPSTNLTDVVGEFFAIEGQAIFKIPRGYPIGSNNLQVMLNGLLTSKDYDYVEVDAHTIKFLHPLVENDYVMMYLVSTAPNVNVVVETHLIEHRRRTIKLNSAYEPKQSTIRVYLNGMLTDSGEDADYIELDSTTIRFNMDLFPGDKVLIRFESSFSGEVIQNHLAKFQKVYLDLAQQLNLLRDEVRRNKTIK